jgi:hypothetical protein
MLIAIAHHGRPVVIHGNAKVVIVGKIHVWILIHV